MNLQNQLTAAHETILDLLKEKETIKSNRDWHASHAERLRKKADDLELQLSMCNYETAAWWEGNDAGVFGVMGLWKQALNDSIPKPGKISYEPLETLYRQTEALRTSREQAWQEAEAAKARASRHAT